MSGALTTLVIVGAIGVALLKRCDWFQLCGSFSDIFGGGGSSSDSSTPDPATATVTTDTADAKDNNKKKKCGCCSCIQRATNLIECTVPGGNKLSFTGGHSLANQCSLCASDPNICKDAKATDVTNKAITRANQNAQGYQITDKNAGVTNTVHCASGYSMSKSGVCVPNNSNKNPKPNKGGDSAGCKSGETYTNCHYDSSQDKMVCACARYARALYSNQVNNYNMSRFARIAI